jgi:signal transduction histidine kinase
MELGGKPTFTAIIRDVSDQQQMERKLLQSERLAAVGQAVAHVSHELKNPLMIIGGFSTQIRKGLGQGKEATKLDMILDEVTRLERLVSDLGDFTKTYKLVKRKTNINAVMQDVINIMSEVHLLDDYDFRQDLSGEIEEIICDPDKLKQVFINIVSNGLEAMPEGGLISVSSRKIKSGIEIRIRDEGTGIPAEDLEHIFEPFYTTRKRGSGLGLSISFKIVEAHSGDIFAMSRPGQGTTFIIRLPDK